jgi:hypothetical protein
MSRPDGSTHLDAVAVGETHIEYRHIGPNPVDDPQRFSGAARLPNDLDIGLAIEHRCQPSANDLVIIEQEDLDRPEFGCGHGTSVLVAEASS